MPEYIDLHMHTTASDGVTSPGELLNIVRASGVRAFAVTDHDTFAGSAEIRNMLKPDDPELITGVELSAGRAGEDLHLLVYLFNTPVVSESSELGRAISEFHTRRNTRGERMVSALQEHGIDISIAMVRKIAGDSPIGRPHVADALLQSGAVKSYDEAFREWIGYGKPAYVEKENILPEEAIELAHKAGGIIILAHPGINNAEEAIPRLVEYGLDGLEVLHPGNNIAQRKRYRKLAKKYNLVISGGSDYHGRNDHHGEVGQMEVPYEFLAPLRERAGRYV